MGDALGDYWQKDASSYLPENIRQLKQMLHEEYQRFPQERLDILVLNMNKNGAICRYGRSYPLLRNFGLLSFLMAGQCLLLTSFCG
ncbi:hypothetical protein TNCV_3939931 [Trichonephila clavipes]|uniref:Uncharacterized protein n=1 Tax=Trichonephila clavipes TaxID=2585209 RepID=A0A8X7BA11_TRICX|nr:hypothetical protein TNCV_3939931 [Trichonephila clavipes]